MFLTMGKTAPVPDGPRGTHLCPPVWTALPPRHAGRALVSLGSGACSLEPPKAKVQRDFPNQWAALPQAGPAGLAAGSGAAVDGEFSLEWGFQ